MSDLPPTITLPSNNLTLAHKQTQFPTPTFTSSKPIIRKHNMKSSLEPTLTASTPTTTFPTTPTHPAAKDSRPQNPQKEKKRAFTEMFDIDYSKDDEFPFLASTSPPFHKRQKSREEILVDTLDDGWDVEGFNEEESSALSGLMRFKAPVDFGRIVRGVVGSGHRENGRVNGAATNGVGVSSTDFSVVGDIFDGHDEEGIVVEDEGSFIEGDDEAGSEINFSDLGEDSDSVGDMDASSFFGGESDAEEGQEDQDDEEGEGGESSNDSDPEDEAYLSIVGRCPICLQYRLNSVTLNTCSHSFCQECFSFWASHVQACKEVVRCPECREDVLGWD